MTHQTPVKRGPSRPEFIAIAAILMATVALSIDIMLPGLGQIAQDLDIAADNRRQWIIGAVFAGLTIGQLLFGPVSDRIGRRPCVFVGAALFAVGSLFCAISESFEAMIAGRVLQGIGAAGPRIVTVAMIRDRFGGQDMARIMSVIMGIFILVPVLAPVVGQGLLVLMPWRGLFLVLAAICVFGAGWLALRQPETLVSPVRLSVRGIVASAREVISSPRPVLFTLASACCYGALMGYINSSQQLFQDVYNVGDWYGVWFGASAAFISGATFINARLVRHWPMDKVCIAAVAIQAVWSLSVTIAIAGFGWQPSLIGWMVYSCPALFLLGLTFGNFNAIALEKLGHIAGLASAMVSSAMSLFSLLIAAAIGLSFDHSPMPIIFGQAVCGIVALGLMTHPAAGADINYRRLFRTKLSPP